MNDEVADHKTTNTDDDPVDPGLDDAQVEEFREEHEETDTTRWVNSFIYYELTIIQS